MFPGYTDSYIEPSTAQDERYILLAEWYDPQAALVRRYKFSFYPKDNSIEMYDLRNRRKFLARTKTQSVNIDDLYIGSQINVYSRMLTFVEYGDEYTKSKLENKSERTVALLMPDVTSKLGLVMNSISENNLQVTRAQMGTLSRIDGTRFYEEYQTETFYNDLLAYIISGPLVALEIMGPNAVNQLKKLFGPENPVEAKEKEPSSLRAMFGTDLVKNSFYCSSSEEAALRDIDFFFSSSHKPRLESSATYNKCTCCVIKPHAVKKGLTGDILLAIGEAGFNVTAVSLQSLEQANAEEFLEIYKGVVSEYPDMVQELCSGPCVALEVSGKDDDTPVRFREFCGPADPEIARHLRPKTLRAMFGKDKIKNALHCSDLPEDGILEVEYFFRILAH